ncbi:LOW QUALITY PROTEIN: defense protein l(2)34Fc [Procambarus clarkii]|uniref:LOW QUALITY PROTEIN: defense protein l(2)34Fc n=1 Tax=Procambarus clarkii TaxID=6728 RepID=UPI0037430788
MMVVMMVMMACMVTTAAGMSDHVPLEACKSMIPEGHGAGAQTSRPPYTLSAQSNALATGPQVTVQLEGLGSGAKFKGFFVRAFDSSSGSSLGSFTRAPKTIDCDGQASGAHHANPDPKRSVTLTWVPPPGYTGSVIFLATVVQYSEGVLDSTLNPIP